MFIAIGLMLLGLPLGGWLQRREARWLPNTVLTLICLLLFLLGAEAGGNQEIVANFHRIGVEALTLSLFAVLGSSLGAWLLWRSTGKKSGGEGGG